ncbi:hypothetical protein FSB78_10540 [Sphingomonas ginsenosidivorax]|uniref:DUF6602 domain-containing protein n=2 Tax=Sphingomonas ginsenosidivorax TaxID=862135 RepID=A0A5C6UGH5_9SPHN|nr:DUF6602 domain-containing protein [Sphingomonas ginsenosidivorax]TXC71331.1 hypothetical protein FSB78_10540 [Sphingomonas ginsenosidivorax]
MSNGVLDVSLSSEFDVIFYDRQRAPAYLKSPDGAVRIVPYEDVYGIVEVKSTLSETTAGDCSKKVMELRGLAELVAETKTAGSMRAMAKAANTVFDYVHDDEDDDEAERTRTAPFAFVIAYKADYEGSASAHFVESAVASMGRPTAIFVVERGYSVRMRNRQANHDITVAARALITGLPKSIVGQSTEHFNALEWEVAAPHLDHEYVNFECSADRCILSFITLASDACRAQVLEEYDLTSLIGGWANHASKPNKK